MTGPSSGGSRAITWSSADGAALAPAPVDLPGMTVTVDPAAPNRVLELRADDPSTLDGFSHLFADDAAAALVADPGSVEHISLTPAATRLATTVAVAGTHLGDLDEPLLMFDLAVGLRGVGAPSGRALALGTTATERVADAIELNEVGGPLPAALVAAVDEMGPDASDELRAWAARMRARIDHGDAQLDLLLIELTGARAAAPSMGATLPEASSPQLADLRPLPPRLLRFTGPDDPDLTVATEGGLLVVTAVLRDDVIEVSAEVLGLFAIAADATTGVLLASAPVEVVGRSVRASLHLPGYAPDDVYCALIGTDTDPAEMRLDLLGAQLIEVDRHLRFSWTMHRRAGAIVAAVDPGAAADAVESARVLAGSAHNAARDAAAAAADLLRQEIRRRRGGPDYAELEAYADRVRALAAQIDGPPAFTGPTGPTLTELAAEVLR